MECKCILLRKRPSPRFMHSLCKNENIPMWGKHRYRITIPGSSLKAFEKMNNKLKVKGSVYMESSGVDFFCFHALADTKQKKPTPLDRGPPLHVNRP